MTDPSGISGEILARAGSVLKTEIAGLDPCKTGEVRLTKGHLLPTKYVLVLHVSNTSAYTIF